MQPKQLNLFEKFAYGVWCMRERHRRGDKPLRGRLTVLGDPSERKWQGHQSRFWAQIAKYKEPEIELAACALGVFFLVDLHKRIGTFTDIGARVGLTWEACGGLLALDDHGADWNTIADAAEYFHPRPRLTAQSVLGYVMGRLFETVPGYDVKRGIWGVQAALDMCQVVAGEDIPLAPPHIIAANKAKKQQMAEWAAKQTQTKAAFDLVAA